MNNDILNFLSCIESKIIKKETPVKDYIIDNSFSMEYGARPIKRYISRVIETMLAKEIVAGDINQDRKYVMDVENNQLIIK